MRRRVVVTGLGALAANGIGIDAFWTSLLAARSGIAPITLFDASSFPVRIAGEVKGFDLSDFLPGQLKLKRMGRHTQLALAATQMALRDAGLDPERLRRHEPLPLFMGVSSSAFDVIETGKDRMAEVGPRRVSPFVVAASQPHAISAALSDAFGVQVQSTTVSSACAAGLQAVGNAFELLRDGQADVALAGGSDAPVTPFAVASFGAAGMVPETKGDPSAASRPFDRDRKGGIMAEGAGMIVLETLEHALARGARPWLEVLGTSSMADDKKSPPGSGLQQTMRLALAHARCPGEAVDYVCAHGPSDPMLDAVETQCIKTVLGRHAYRIPVTSIKGVTGNPLSAAGPLQLVACALAFRDNTVPPTANYEHPDPACDLDYVPKQPRLCRLQRALVNVHGMGGSNTSLVVGRAP